eukprot:gene9437-12751_t
MKTLTLNLPETFDIDEKEAKSLLAAKLYEKGSLSLGQAAELAGYSKRTFMDILGNYDVSIFNYPAEELEKDLFGNITITEEIAKEFGETLPPWFEIKQPVDRNYQTIIEASIDKGEASASAIALAIEYDDCLLIIDDLKGRKFAQQLGLTIIGTIGIIVDAKLNGIIPSVQPILAKIKQTNFRISQKLESAILERAEE